MIDIDALLARAAAGQVKTRAALPTLPAAPVTAVKTPTLPVPAAPALAMGECPTLDCDDAGDDDGAQAYRGERVDPDRFSVGTDWDGA